MRKNILAGFILLMSLSAGIEAQNLDQDCNPIVMPLECRRISDSIHLLETEKAHLQAELPQANSVMKGQLVRSIRALNRRLDSAKADLARCRREHEATPRVLAPSVLRARFTGTAKVRAHLFEVPEVDLDLVLRFTRNRCRVTITSFPMVFKTRAQRWYLGLRNADVVGIDGGAVTFHPVSGNMTMSIGVALEKSEVHDSSYETLSLSTSHSEVWGEWGDWRVNLTGSPLAEGGSITLVGTTRFRHGFLEGRSGSLVITGNISPHP